MMAEIFLNKRFQNLIELKEKQKLNSLYLTSAEAIRHFTDLDGEGISLLVTDNQVVLLCNKMFEETLAELPSLFELIVISEPQFAFLTKSNLLTGNKIGFEGNNLDYATANYLKKSFRDSLFSDISAILKNHLAVLDEECIRRMKKAADITGKIYVDIIKSMNDDISEIEVASEIRYLAKKYGAEKESFEPIVAFGTSSSLPHAQSSLKKLRRSSVALIDFGVKYKGINSDISRTIIMSNNKEINDNYKLVMFALSEVEKLISAEVEVKELDAKVRAIFRQVNLENNFIHSLGHGIGYAVHQAPRISINSSERLIENQVIAIEPALYFKGKYGIRIENNYLVTKNGFINLTNF